MTMNENQPINYRNRKRKTIRNVDKKKFTLAILLAASITFGTAAYGVKEAIDSAIDTVTYKLDSDRYEQLIRDNSHVVNNEGDYFVETIDVAEDLLSEKIDEINSREDFYHALLSTARKIEYNRQDNFKDLVRSLELDELSKTSSIYPSTQEFEEFLNANGLIKDGKIDFDEWKELDQKTFQFQRKIEKDAEERKSI